MKKHTAILFSTIISFLIVSTLCTTSCKKTKNGSSTADSGMFYFHLHTQVVDSTIGGNTDGYDSNTTGTTNHWYADALGRPIELFVPQFFISNVILVNANGSQLQLNNIAILKGLDSEDYYIVQSPDRYLCFRYVYCWSHQCR